MGDFYSNMGKHAHGIEDLFAAPLIAISRANSNLSKEQLTFIMDTCFEREKNTDRYHAKTIKMVMKRTVFSGFHEETNKELKEEVSFDFELPILTLLSLNTLCIKDVKTKFNVEILSYNGKEKTTKKEDKANVKTNLKTNQPLKGVINHKSAYHNETANLKKSSIDIEITGREIPLPEGLKTLLDVYSKNIITTHKNTNE